MCKECDRLKSKVFGLQRSLMKARQNHLTAIRRDLHRLYREQPHIPFEENDDI
jgi:hypothetical protein